MVKRVIRFLRSKELFSQYLFLLFIGCLLFLYSCSTDHEAPFTLQKGKVFAHEVHGYSFIDDLDNNAYSEIVFVKQDDPAYEYMISVMDLETRFHFHSEPLWSKLLDVKAYDITGNGHKEILYTYLKEDSLFLKIYEPFSGGRVVLHERIAVVHRRFPNRLWDGGFLIASFVDLNHDGFTDLILLYQANYDRYPRGLVAYDLAHRQKLWEYRVATSVHYVLVKDVNRDGKWEIFLDSGSPGNGARINHTDDFHSYFIVLDEEGQLVYHKEMGEENSGVYVVFAKFSDPGQEVLLTQVFSGNAKYYRNLRLMKWNLEHWPDLKPEIVNSSVRLFSRPTVLPYHGIPHIFGANAEGQLCMLDSTLSLVKVFPMDVPIASYMGSYDLDHDGKKEMLWRSKYGKATILDEDFRHIYTLPSVNDIFEIEQGRGRPVRYALLEENGQFYEFSLKHVTLIQRAFSSRVIWLIGMLVLANLTFWAWLLARAGNWKWYRKQLQYFDASLSAVLVLDNGGRLVTCNQTAIQFLNKPFQELRRKNVQEVFYNSFTPVCDWLIRQLRKGKSDHRRFSLETHDGERVLEVYLQLVRSRMGRGEGAVVIINDVTPVVHSRRTATWLTVAQKLAHEIKNPLTTIRLTLQRLKYEYESNPVLQKQVGEFVEESLEEVNRLRRVVDDFMRFSKIERTPFTMVDIRKVMCDVVERYHSILPEGIEVKVNIPKSLPQIQGDCAQITSLLTNVMDNALQAIEPPGEIRLKAGVIEKIKPDSANLLEELLEIEIEDSGHGMDQETLRKIFQPFFTTKDGGSGLGLSIVQRIVEDHNGHIEVFSQKGLGTRLIIQFPLSLQGKELS